MPAYQKTPEAMKPCSGPECEGCSSKSCYAKGGEVGPMKKAEPKEPAEVADGEPEMEDDLRHAMGGEFMSALERKDYKGVMSALEAIVLSCKGKE